MYFPILTMFLKTLDILIFFIFRFQIYTHSHRICIMIHNYYSTNLFLEFYFIYYFCRYFFTLNHLINHLIYQISLKINFQTIYYYFQTANNNKLLSCVRPNQERQYFNIKIFSILLEILI